jgi:hypothetical protein
MANPEERELSGKVVTRQVGGASKSAHPAVVLESSAGEFVLRRAGGNPFFDPDLEHLVGRSIRCHGTVDGYVFTIARWTDANEGDTPNASS